MILWQTDSVWDNKNHVDNSISINVSNTQLHILTRTPALTLQLQKQPIPCVHSFSSIPTLQLVTPFAAVYEGVSCNAVERLFQPASASLAVNVPQIKSSQSPALCRPTNVLHCERILSQSLMKKFPFWENVLSWHLQIFKRGFLSILGPV